MFPKTVGKIMEFHPTVTEGFFLFPTNRIKIGKIPPNREISKTVYHNALPHFLQKSTCPTNDFPFVFAQIET